MVRQQNIAHLLSSNTIPNSLEAISIQAGIESITTKIVQLRSQLLGLEEELRVHRAAVSLVRKFPLEILGEIFGLVVEPPLNKDGRSQLLNLCLVCKTWRDAAFLIHRLWNGVRTSENSLAFKGITDWLGRSGGTPKSLEFIASDHGDCSDPASYCKRVTVALAKVLTDGPTLDHLSLEYNGPQCFQNLYEAFNICHTLSELKTRPWDCLRSLSLRFRRYWEESPDPSTSSFLYIPSSVTSFHLHLPPYWLGEQMLGTMVSTPLHLPPDLLRRLTSFSIHCDWNGLQVSTALMHCQNIKDFTLNLGGRVYFEDPNNPSSISFARSEIVLPKLQTLRLRSFSPHNLDLISFLETPVLNALDIEFSNEDTEEDCLDDFDFTQNIHEFIKERSKCEDTFYSLSIRSASSTTREFAKLLEGLPSITHLTFADIHFTDGKALFHPNLSKALPRLEKLELLNVSRSDFSFWCLMDFLRSRRPRVVDGKSLFKRRPESAKQLVLTYRPEARVSKPEHRYDSCESVKRLRRDFGMSINIGPLSSIYIDS